MFSLRSNGLPCGAFSLRSPHPKINPAHVRAMPPDITPRRSAGDGPRSDPADVRNTTIGVRVSASEYTSLRLKAAQMHMTPAQWLREAALTRRLPSPPVAATNREQYAELTRLAVNLNQLARLANEGGNVKVADGLLARMAIEAKRLRLVLLGLGEEPWKRHGNRIKRIADVHGEPFAVVRDQVLDQSSCFKNDV
ncbi:MAG: hypothetical protein JWQ01_4744 [Massilia sp.]|nr:hypothetical protein [Massilia sp.]